MPRGLATVLVMAWVVGCFFLRGDLGKYLDDCVLTLVDPATGELAHGAHPWQDYSYFWRPLHLVLLYGLNTVFWRWDAAIHLFAAACHGWCAWRLYRFLRAAGTGGRGRAGAHVCGAAAAVFMVCPLNFQVVLWPSTVSSAIGTGMLLWVGERVVRGRWSAWGTGAMALGCACFYEQPAAAFVAVPVLVMGCGGERRVRAGVVHGAAVIAGLGVYWLLLRWTAPGFARGSGETVAGAGEMVARVWETMGGAWNTAAGERTGALLRGSWLNGLEAQRNPMGVAMGAVLVGAVVVWVAEVVGGRAESEEARADKAPVPPGAVPPWVVMAFGAAVVVWSLLPIALVESQRVQHRLLYVPLVGVVIVAAAVVGRVSVGARGGWTRVIGGMMAAIAGAAVAWGAVCLVGFQALYRQRWVLDERQLRQLAQALPEVPEGTVLVPLKLRESAAGTGVAEFDGFLRSVFETGWAARARARDAFGRADVRATHVAGSGGVPLEQFGETAVRYRPVPTIYEKLIEGREGWDVRRGAEIEYSKMVPFTTVKSGDVELVWKLTVVEDGKRKEITFPLVEKAVRERGARHGEFRMGRE